MLDRGGIRLTDWFGIGGGEAGHTAHDPDDPGVVYAGEYLGIFTRFDRRTGQARNVTPYPNNLSGHGIEDGRYRFQWTAPIHISPHDGKTVYYGGNVVFRTRDGGQSWDVISPDLTRNDDSKQKWTGGPITGDNTGVEHYCTVFALAESPRQKGLVWAGSDDGRVHVTKDGGGSWTNVTAAMAGFPEWGTVSLIEPSPHDAATAYVVVDNHRMDDMRPHLWKTSDQGKTWKRLGPGLPADVYLHAVREDPVRQRTPLSRDRARGHVLHRRRRHLDRPEAQPAHRGRARPRGERRRPRGGHPRPVHLDLRPPGGAPRLRRPGGREEPAPIRSGSGHALGQGRRGVGREGRGGEPAPRGRRPYFAKQKPEGEVVVEVRDAKGALVRRLTSKPEPPEWPEGDPDGGDEDKPYAVPRRQA